MELTNDSPLPSHVHLESQNTILFVNRVFGDAVTLKSYWIRVDLKNPMNDVLKRSHVNETTGHQKQTLE